MKGEMPARVMAAQLALSAAWERVKANGGMAGSDGQTVYRFGCGAAANLRGLQARLAGMRYEPWPLRLCEVPKKSGTARLLLVPAVEDRVAQTAASMWLQRRFDREADPSSYAYRPGRGVSDALRALRSLREQGYQWVLDADIRGFFDNIDHAVLLRRLRGWLGENAPLADWIARWLKGPVWDGTGLYRLERGVPQGSPLSPVLSNFYLGEFDQTLRSRGIRFIRFADDFLALCRTPFDLGELRSVVEGALAGLKLELNEEKTRSTSFSGHFRFLGAEVRDEAILLPFEKPRPERAPLYLAPPMPPSIRGLYRRGHWAEYPEFVWTPRGAAAAVVGERAPEPVGGLDALRRAYR